MGRVTQNYTITIDGKFIGRRSTSWEAISYAKKIIQPDQIAKVYRDPINQTPQLVDEFSYAEVHS